MSLQSPQNPLHFDAGSSSIEPPSGACADAIRADDEQRLATRDRLPVPPSAPPQIKIRRFGWGSHDRPVAANPTRFTRDNPATWFSI